MDIVLLQWIQQKSQIKLQSFLQYGKVKHLEPNNSFILFPKTSKAVLQVLL